MILANYAQQNRNCVRELGCGFTNPLAQFKPPLFQNFYVTDTLMPDLKLSAFNHGYNTEKAWHLAMSTGGVAATGVSGSGGASGLVLLVKFAQALLTGDGTLTATGSLIVQALAALSGSGTISSAAVQAFLLAVANLTGSGGASGPATGLAAMMAALTGSGTAAGSTATGIAAASANITVTGTGLTTANVGEAVWSALAAANDTTGTMGEKLNDAGSATNPWTEVIESGFTAAEILRILAAFAAGSAVEMDGSGTTEFVGIDGVTVRITGNLDGSGGRTIISLDGS